MKYFEFNLNYDILVKITDVGIKHYVVTYNKTMARTKKRQ